jgi:hypothetical protein
MTECAECLSALSTARLSDVTPGSASALHAARCPACMQVVEEVRQSEYRLALGLNEAAAGHASRDLAWAAIEGSEFRRRQRIARWVRGGLAVAAMGVFGIFMESRAGSESSTRPRVDVTTLRLRCLSSQAAADLVTPYLRSSGSIVYRADDAHAITIRGRPAEIAAATSQIDRFDDPKECTLPAPASATAGTPEPALAPLAPLAPGATRTRSVEIVTSPAAKR